MTKLLNRRTLLRGAGGIAVGLPFLEIMGLPKHAQGAYGDAAKRLVIITSPHGRSDASNDKWRPEGMGSDFTFAEFMTDFTPFQQDTIVLSGLEASSARNQSGNPHSRGAAHMLTATEHLEETLPGDTSGGSVGFAGGISIDQHVANSIEKKSPTKFASLQFGVQSGADFAVSGATTRSYVSYSAAGEPVPAEDNPAAMFDRLFSEFDVDAAELERLRAQRRSVLDLVTEDFERLNPTLGTSDRARLDEHLSKIREIEMSIGVSSGELSPQCALPDLGPAIKDYRDNDSFPEVGRQQTDLMTMALACDMTRVATFQWSTGQSSTRHSWNPDAGDSRHHGITHGGGPDRDAYDAITQWYAGRVAEFITQLRAIQEPDGGSMVDNTIVLWVAGETAGADGHG